MTAPTERLGAFVASVKELERVVDAKRVETDIPMYWLGVSYAVALLAVAVFGIRVQAYDIAVPSAVVALGSCWVAWKVA